MVLAAPGEAGTDEFAVPGSRQAESLRRRIMTGVASEDHNSLGS
jgi:hypothetical protein